MHRKPIPPIAYLLTAGTGVALAALAIPTLRAHGTGSVFFATDASFYRAIARDPFGTGQAFVRGGLPSEIPYRYGRIGLPLLGWLLALGRPGAVPWTLIIVDLAAIAAVPGLAAVLANEYGAPPIAGVAVLCSSLLFIRDTMYAEPLLIAFVLLAYILEARGRRRGALVAFAFAILVKETAVLALVPWVWKAFRVRDFKRVAGYACTALPYAAWCIWLRFRVGEFPFLAHTYSRTGAIGWPFAGLKRVIDLQTPRLGTVITILVVTIALCCIGAYLARDLPIGMLTAALAILFTCLGPNALRLSQETFRLLSFPQVFAVLCIAVAIGRRFWPNPEVSADQTEMPSSGARNLPV